MEEYLIMASVLSIVGIMFSSIWFILCLITKKDRKKPIEALKISVIIFTGSFILSIFKLTTTLILLVIFLLYKFKKKNDAKNLEKKMLIEKERNVENERRGEMIKRTFDLIFMDDEMKHKLKDFILNHTKKYDYGEISYIEYSSLLDMFLNYISKTTNNQLNIPISEDNEDVKKYWESNKSFMLERHMIEGYIESKKLEVYSENMKNILSFNNCETLEELSREYLEMFGENGLKEINLKIFSKATGEDYRETREIVEQEFKKIKDEHELQRLERHLFESKSNLKDMNYIDSLSGLEFEDFLKDLFISFGYKCEDLPYSNDYGADLIISKGFNRTVIQAKNYNGSVGNKAIQEVISAKVYYKCDTAMVITNSQYTQNALKMARASGVILIDREKLNRILSEGNMYFNSLVS